MPRDGTTGTTRVGALALLYANDVADDDEEMAPLGETDKPAVEEATWGKSFVREFKLVSLLLPLNGLELFKRSVTSSLS